jgi:hypothetical protein
VPNGSSKVIEDLDHAQELEDTQSSIQIREASKSHRKAQEKSDSLKLTVV